MMCCKCISSVVLQKASAAAAVWCMTGRSNFRGPDWYELKLRLTKAGVLGCRTGPKRSGTPSIGLAQEALRGLAPSRDWISAAAVGVLGIGDACTGA